MILESKNILVDDAALTGETYTVEKEVQVLAAETPLSKRVNTLYMGTHVTSGTAKAVVVHTGTETEFGQVSVRLRFRPPETEFEHGVRHCGYLLMEVTLLLGIGLFPTTVPLLRPPFTSLLFPPPSPPGP